MSWDKTWDEVFINNEWGKYPAENLIRFIAKNFYKAKREEIKILEIGCGTGANIWYLARERFNTYGIDGSSVGIEIIKQRLRNENLSADLRVGDILNLPYIDNHFDAVIDIECLYANSFQNTGLILEEVNRVLKNMGLFFSRSFSDKMYIGNSRLKNVYEYQSVKDGPLAGKGFVRLLALEQINELYGKRFEIVSTDIDEHTINNGDIFISEYIIISRKIK